MSVWIVVSVCGVLMYECLECCMSVWSVDVCLDCCISVWSVDV